MEQELKTLGYDGGFEGLEIIFSETFIIYDEILSLKFLDKNFVFRFSKSEQLPKEKDVYLVWSEGSAIISLSKKFRDSLGSGMTKRLPILKTGEGKTIFFAIFGQQFGESALHVTINFYLK